MRSCLDTTANFDTGDARGRMDDDNDGEGD